MERRLHAAVPSSHRRVVRLAPLSRVGSQVGSRVGSEAGSEVGSEAESEVGSDRPSYVPFGRALLSIFVGLHANDNPENENRTNRRHRNNSI